MVILMEEKYMLEALKEAKKSFDKGDVPVGAIVVDENNNIIARAHNEKELKKIATKHAEILVIERACKKKKSWRLEKCTIYVTLEPCLMCAGAIMQSRIHKIVYATSNEKFGFVGSIENVLDNEKNNHKVKIIKGVLEQESQQILRMFFKQKRKR
jgi:tRNA(adenine34) deaminase